MVLGGDGDGAGDGAGGSDPAALVAAALRIGRGGKKKQGGGKGGAGGGGQLRLSRLTLEEQLARCLEGCRGTAEQLNTILVAALRAMGLLVRTTW